MPNARTGLGICYFNNRLFYAISADTPEPALSRIGAVDFNFNITDALTTANPQQLPRLRNIVVGLKDRFGVHHLNVLVEPIAECWSVLPRLAYDDAREREAHIAILTSGSPRKHVEPAWHALSNEDYKLLQLRNTHRLKGLHKLTEHLSNTALISAFEVGQRWVRHARPGGAFLSICCFENCLSISSFLLGKLRGATFIRFENADDLPYLWRRHAQQLSWMNGLHEEIHVYGMHAWHIKQQLQHLWDDESKLSLMKSLDAMQVEASETTYSFELACAHPAIMLALQEYAT